MKFGKARNTLNRSYNEKKREGGVAKEMKALGYDFVSEFPIGQDPETGAVHSFAVGVGGNEDTAAYWHVVDWTQGTFKNDRKRGISLAEGMYGVPTVAQAEAEAKKAAEYDLKNYSWVQPGTARPVVGSGDGGLQYERVTSGGHTILAMYADDSYADRTVYYVVATRPDIGPGVIWGKDYNVNTGLWRGGDYEQTRREIERKSKEMELIYVDNKALEEAYKGDDWLTEQKAKRGNSEGPMKLKSKSVKPERDGYLEKLASDLEYAANEIDPYQYMDECGIYPTEKGFQQSYDLLFTVEGVDVAIKMIEDYAYNSEPFYTDLLARLKARREEIAPTVSKSRKSGKARRRK